MAYYSTNKTRVAEILPNELYLALVQRPGAGIPADIPTNSLCYWLDDDLIYEPFCADFGPCNLAHTYRFCMRVNNLMKQVSIDLVIYFYISKKITKPLVWRFFVIDSIL